MNETIYCTQIDAVAKTARFGHVVDSEDSQSAAVYDVTYDFADQGKGDIEAPIDEFSAIYCGVPEILTKTPNYDVSPDDLQGLHEAIAYKLSDLTQVMNAA